MLLVLKLFGYHVVSSDTLFLCYRNSQRPFRNFRSSTETTCLCQCVLYLR
ncbi:hypothetical protein DsansV1_C21g0168921 [Dioscorea sansibarensis]